MYPQSLKIYSASVMFWYGEFSCHLSVTATSNTYLEFDNFVFACKLEASLHDLFSKSNVYINAMELYVLPDGRLYNNQSRILEFKNFHASPVAA